MLLERADALDGLRAALVRVRDDSSGEVCTVSGEAGVGKSTLLRAFTGAVTEPVWWGACDDLRTPRPLGPLLDLAASAGGANRRAVADGTGRAELFTVTLDVLTRRTGVPHPRMGDEHRCPVPPGDTGSHQGSDQRATDEGTEPCRAIRSSARLTPASPSRSTMNGANTCLGVVDQNAVEGVTWVHSYVTPDTTRTYCVYDGPDPESIRRAATRNGLQVDAITEVRVLDPYFYRTVPG